MGAISFNFFNDGIKIEFGVTRLPGRKNAALYKMSGNNVDVLAYFRNEVCAKEFESMLNEILDRTSNKINNERGEL